MCWPRTSVSSWLKFIVSPPPCFDWQLHYLGLTVLLNKWLWQLLLNTSPPQDSNISNKAGQTTLHTEPRESLCCGWTGQRVYWVCVCVLQEESSRESHFTQWVKIRNTLHCLVRGAVIKPLKGLGEQSIKCVESQWKKAWDMLYASISCRQPINESHTAGKWS